MISIFHARLSPVATVFLIWSLVGGLVMAAGITAESFADAPAWLRPIAAGIMRGADALWICLAAWLVWDHEARLCGKSRAAVVFAGIALVSGAAEWLGATTGMLFGHYSYSGQFGWRLGGVLPFTIPLAWYAVVTGACRLCDRLHPWPLPVRAIMAGALATATDFNLEPMAMHSRGYWQWTDGPGGALLAWPPMSNFLTWFALASLLAPAVPRRCPEPVGGIPGGLSPVAVLAAMNFLFLLAHVGRWILG